MPKTSLLLIEQCRKLRKEGFTLGEIAKKTRLPKTTIHGHVYDIPSSPVLEKKIRRIQEENTRRLTEFVIKTRKGKCAPGREISLPKDWSYDLVLIIAHFLFDGEIRTHSCVYNNRNEALIQRVESLMRKIFNLKPRYYLNRKTGVSRLFYHHVELANYIYKKSEVLKKYIKVNSLKGKRLFLKAFFDDEGSVHFPKRLVRGFQHDPKILELVQDLLKDFGIDSRIDKKYKEIVISREENLIRFRDKINFSKGVYINPERKNSIWKQKLEKRKILERIIKGGKNAKI